MSKGDAVVTQAELASHKTSSSCWIAVDGIVYDVTKFLRAHPGGGQVILDVAGKDVTEEFFTYHKKEVLAKYGPKLRVGVLENYKGPVIDPVPKSPAFDTYTPFAEVPFVRGWKSPYMNDSHKRMRTAIRAFVDKHILPDLEYMHERGEDPSEELFSELGKSGIIACRVGKCAMPFVKKLGLSLPGNISPDEFSYFHQLVAVQELYRIGSGGVSDGLGVGATIGLPPVIYFGSEELKERIVPAVLLGKTRACLAITEPVAGSDVANVSMTAKKSPDGSFYTVNGLRKWITGSGTKYPTVYSAVVRTGGPGHKGLSMMLIEDPTDPSKGTITKHRIKTSYSGAAGTALLEFDNVVVPAKNLLGQEGQGFMLTMANFNGERLYLCMVGSAFARTAVAECYRWAMQRKAFGKRLIDQPVIRYKLAEMSAMVECLDAWLEHTTYQMDTMNPMEQFEKLSSPIALMKFHFGRCGWRIADQACQIFGGRAVTRTGMGRLIEAFKNEAKFTAITGGSEEVIADLAVRQAVAQCDRQRKKKPEALVMSRL
jgi:alkylation response protein AidB-like acyl-CoA dehydrogenase/predicted heme/steroid binding protein